MKHRPRWALLTFGALIVLTLYTYPTWRKLLTVRGGTTADYANASDDQRAIFTQMRKTPNANPATAYAAMLITVIAPTSDVPTPDSAAMTAIKSGDFIQIDAVHTASGHATLYRRIDNSLLLRFDNFSVTNGPNLNVYLSAADAPTTFDEMAVGQRQILIGALKGSVGNQNYTYIPPELDLSRYKSVVLFDDSLKTVYSTAPLQ